MIHHSRHPLLLCLALAAAAALPAPAGAQSSPIDVVTEEADTSPPTENAGRDGRMHFMTGSREAKKGAKLLERAAAEGDAAAREELRQQSRAAFEAAIPELLAAIQLQPASADAYLVLGDALRHLGRHPEAAKVHTIALARLPKDLDNLRAWTDTMLAMHLFGDTVQTYEKLRATHPEGAAALLARVREWVAAARRTPPADLAPADLERLEQWVAASAG